MQFPYNYSKRPYCIGDIYFSPDTSPVDDTQYYTREWLKGYVPVMFDLYINAIIEALHERGYLVDTHITTVQNPHQYNLLLNDIPFDRSIIRIYIPAIHFMKSAQEELWKSYKLSTYGLNIGRVMLHDLHVLPHPNSLQVIGHATAHAESSLVDWLGFPPPLHLGLIHKGQW